MKVLIPLLFLILLGLNIWQFLERQSLRDKVNESRAEVTRLESITAPLRSQAAALRTEKKELTEKLARLQESPADAESTKGSVRNPMEALGEALENPAMREMMAAQQRATLDAQYQRLYENLGLEGEELEHFRKLITEAQMSVMEDGMKLADANLSAQERQDIVAHIAAAQEDLNARVKEFLNDDADYDYYTFYSDTLGERVAMNGLRGALEGIGQPLDTEAEEALVKLMYDERQAVGFENDYFDQDRFDPSTITQEKVDRFMAQYDQLQSKLAESAGTLLSAEQLEAFRANQSTSRAMQEMGLGMMMQMLNGSRPSGNASQ